MSHGDGIRLVSLIVMMMLLATSIVIVSPSVKGDPSIVITSPDATSIWYTGGIYEIKWDGSSLADEYVKIECLFQYHTELITSNTPNDGSYSWTIPTTYESGTTNIRIHSTYDDEICTDSDTFQITKSGFIISMITDIIVGNTYNISWIKTGITGTDVKIEVTNYYDQVVYLISASTINDGTFSWTVPLEAYSLHGCGISIISLDDTNINGKIGVSIGVPAVTVEFISPITNTVWTKGQIYDITWTTTALLDDDDQSIELDYQGSSSPIQISENINILDLHFSWSIPNSITPRSDYFIRMYHNYDVVNGRFTIGKFTTEESDKFQIVDPIQNSINVLSPIIGTNWTSGNTYEITWSITGTPGSDVMIQYAYTSFTSPVIVVSSTPNDGTYFWTIPTTLTPRTDYIIRVISLTDSSIYGQSSYFIIDTISVEYSELRVTLRIDGTEHDYIKTTDPTPWTSSETFWASGDAYNKNQTTSGIYTIIEYDLDDIALYKKGSQTCLSSNGEGDSRIWTYSDHFTETVDVYVLTLPSGCEYISSSPTYENMDGNKITWNDVDGQDTQFKSSTYNDMIDTSSNDSSVSSSNLLYFLGIGIGLILLLTTIILIVVIKKKKRGQ